MPVASASSRRSVSPYWPATLISLLNHNDSERQAAGGNASWKNNKTPKEQAALVAGRYSGGDRATAHRYRRRELLLKCGEEILPKAERSDNCRGNTKCPAAG